MQRQIFKIIGVSIGLIGLLGVYFFYESRSERFRYQDILSQLSSDLAQQVVPEGVNARLQQKFFYLGSGKQCHAFLGEDHKTVLKFFRHSDASFEKILKKCSISLERWYGKFFIHYNPTSVLKSYRLAHDLLPELTG